MPRSCRSKDFPSFDKSLITTFSPFVVGKIEIRVSSLISSNVNLIFPSCGAKCSSVLSFEATLILNIRFCS
ncbi:MAG: hypothetical protein WCJ19_03630 [bacterium]